jgi:hypothetical protein
VTDRIKRIDGYKVMKRFRRGAEPVEQFFLVRIYSVSRFSGVLIL